MTLTGQNDGHPLKTSGNLKFIPATAADAETLLKLVEKYYRFDHIDFDADRVRGGLKSLLGKRGLGRAWLIRTGRKTAGYIVVTFGFDYEFGGRTALITDLYLEPQSRGRGLGRLALAHVEAFCRKAGMHALELQVETKNKRAVRLYRAFGFRPLPRTPMSKSIRRFKKNRDR